MSALETQPRLVVDQLIAEGDYVVVVDHGEGGVTTYSRHIQCPARTKDYAPLRSVEDSLGHWVGTAPPNPPRPNATAATTRIALGYQRQRPHPRGPRPSPSVSITQPPCPNTPRVPSLSPRETTTTATLCPATLQSCPHSCLRRPPRAVQSIERRSAHSHATCPAPRFAA